MTASHASEHLVSYIDGYSWICVFCTSRNPIHADPCPRCGLSFRGGTPGRATAARSARWRPSPRTGAPMFEVATAAVLFACWRLGDIAAGTHTAGAITRGRELWCLERTLAIPSERRIQASLLPHAELLHVLNIYYASAHLGGMAAAASWLYLRHRQSYGRWRNAVISSTAACFAVQLVSVAPPRLVPGLGMVDTARRFGESVYGRAGLGNQVSSMPSVHFAWSLLVAALVIAVGKTRKRWLVVAHPALTLLAIIGTANHYWLDAAVAAVITLGCLRLTRPARAP